jgi:hypothetical protein
MLLPVDETSTAMLDGIEPFSNSGNSTVRTKIDFVGRLVDKSPRRPISCIVLVLLAQSLRRVRILAWFR